MHFQRAISSVSQLIGDTPLVALHGFETGACRLFAKLENRNPSGSIQDRVAQSIITAAEQAGYLQAGGTLVDAVSVNAGLALATIAALRGYRVILVMPDTIAKDKLLHLKALGADLRLARADAGSTATAYYRSVARRIAQETPGAFFADQFANPANPLAHETTTAPEIWEQTGNEVDVVVTGAVTGGTLTGLRRFFRAVAPDVEIVLAVPETAEAGYNSDNIDHALADHVCAVSQQQSQQVLRDLLRCEGIFAGPSSGIILAAALQYCQAQKAAKNVVALICDGGSVYASDIFENPHSRGDGDERTGHATDTTLADLIVHRHDEGAVEATSPDENLLDAYGRMRRNAISQLPVLEEGRLVGIIDESDILKAVDGPPEGRWSRFAASVATAMTAKPRVLQITAPLSAVQSFFDRDEVALVVQGTEFVGLITRTDMINYLRCENYRDGDTGEN